MGEAVNAELKAVDKSEPLPELPDPVIHPLPSNELRGWLLAEKYLKRALEHTDEWDLRDVATQYCSGKIGIILCLDRHRSPFGALCVEICDYPKKRVLQVHLFGAEDHSEELWMSFIWPQLQELARNSGCSSIMGTGRDGWVRKLHAKHRYLWEVGLYPDQEK
jgi:hypothetical protein